MIWWKSEPKNEPKVFKRGDRGRCMSGGYTFVALEDSVPYEDVPGGRYIVMRVLDEQTGQVLGLHGFPTCYLEHLTSEGIESP